MKNVAMAKFNVADKISRTKDCIDNQTNHYFILRAWHKSTFIKKNVDNILWEGCIVNILVLINRGCGYQDSYFEPSLVENAYVENSLAEEVI